MHRMSEAQMLAHKRAVDAERKAQAVLKRKHAAATGMARLLAATPRTRPATVFEGTR